MGAIMIRCPESGRAIATGMDMSAAEFARLPVFFGRAFCAFCLTEHRWFAREAWVQVQDGDCLAPARMRPLQAKLGAMRR